MGSKKWSAKRAKTELKSVKCEQSFRLESQMPHSLPQCKSELPVQDLKTSFWDDVILLKYAVDLLYVADLYVETMLYPENSSSYVVLDGCSKPPKGPREYLNTTNHGKLFSRNGPLIMFLQVWVWETKALSPKYQ